MLEMKPSKGDITRNRIYEYAKESFFYHGYKNTTITGISNSLDIGLGNITYYFKTKDVIATQVIVDYLDRINEFLVGKVDPNEKFFYRHFVASMIYYNVILKQKNNKRFYMELFEKEALYKVMIPAIEYTYPGYISDYNIRLTKMQYKVLMAADLGSRREIMLGYFRKDFVMPIEDLVITLLLNTGKLAGIPEIEMFNVAHRAYVTSMKLDYSEIYLLIPNMKDKE